MSKGPTLNQQIAQKLQTITREEMHTIIDVLKRDEYGEDVFCTAATFPVSRRCKATISFSKRPTVDEWDALLAHIAFYKTWFSEGEAPGPTSEQVADEVCAALDEREHNRSQTRRNAEGRAL